jgi:hypothetical protein
MTWTQEEQIQQDLLPTNWRKLMKETIEIGAQRFNKNLLWLLCEWGVDKSEVGQKAFGPRLIPENGRKRVCRLLNGQVELRIQDMEALAGVFGIPPAVLVYGTEKQLMKSFEAAAGGEE